MTAFSIPEKMFPKTESLMCTLRAHINRIHHNKHRREIGLSVSHIAFLLRKYAWIGHQTHWNSDPRLALSIKGWISTGDHQGHTG